LSKESFTEDDDIIVAKFCRKVSSGDNNINKHCLVITRQLIGSSDGKPDLEAVDKLSKITGLSEDELIELYLQSCPGCPE